MKITLKDGSVREYDHPMRAIDIAADISEGLARMACLAEINGEPKDLRTEIADDSTLSIFTAKDPEGLRALRHTAAHVMAQAVLRIHPDAKLAIGPAIADGFYYDIDFAEPLPAEELPKIEEEMKKIIKEDIPLERYTLPREEALAWAQRTGLLRDWGVSLSDLLVRNRITRLEAIGLLAFYIDRNVK